MVMGSKSVKTASKAGQDRYGSPEMDGHPSSWNRSYADRSRCNEQLSKSTSSFIMNEKLRIYPVMAGKSSRKTSTAVWLGSYRSRMKKLRKLASDLILCLRDVNSDFVLH